MLIPKLKSLRETKEEEVADTRCSILFNFHIQLSNESIALKDQLLYTSNHSLMLSLKLIVVYGDSSYGNVNISLKEFTCSKLV